MITAARLGIVRHWKLKHLFLLTEWNNEVWKTSINGKLTWDINFKKGLLKDNMFLETWQDFLNFVLLKGEGRLCKEEIMLFWKHYGGHHNQNFGRKISLLVPVIGILISDIYFLNCVKICVFSPSFFVSFFLCYVCIL